MSLLVSTTPRSTMAAITVETITDAATFRDLREEWTDLLDRSAADCLFLTWEWLYTWWTHLGVGRRLFIVTVRRAESSSPSRRSRSARDGAPASHRCRRSRSSARGVWGPTTST